jgi:predicted glutamine amidotransferase
MCGLIWVHRKDGKHAHKTVVKRFENQKTRGVDGFGFIENEELKGGGYALKAWYQSQTEAPMRAQIKQATVSDILFHHRIPTSTPNVREATHPILVSHPSLKYDYYVVHNGVIHNADILRKKHEEQGYVYNTIVQTFYRSGASEYLAKEQFNDSEALAIDLAQVIESDRIGTTATGSIAFIVQQVEKTQDRKVIAMYFGHNGQNPLMIEDVKDLLCLSSAGNGEDVETHVLFKYDYATKKIEKVRDLEIGYKPIVTRHVPNTHKNPTQKTMGFRVNEHGEEDTGADYWPPNHKVTCLCKRCERYWGQYKVEAKRSVAESVAENNRTMESLGISMGEEYNDEEPEIFATLTLANGTIRTFETAEEFTYYNWDIMKRIEEMEADLETARAMYRAANTKRSEKIELEETIESYEKQLVDLDGERCRYNDIYDTIDWTKEGSEPTTTKAIIVAGDPATPDTSDKF